MVQHIWTAALGAAFAWSIFLPAAIAADPLAEVLRDGPVLYLRLSEESGDAALDTANQSGEPQQGPQNGQCLGVRLGAEGAPVQSQDANYAAEFDGVDDAIIVEQSVMEDVLKLEGSFTLEVWIKPETGGPTYQNLVSKGTFGDDGTVRCALLYFGQDSPPVQAGTIRFDATGSRRRNALDSNTPVPVGQWTHVAVTCDPASGNVKLYINGQLDAQDTQGTIDSPASVGEPLAIGALSYGIMGQSLTNFFRGALDEVVVFGRELAPDRIQAHAKRIDTGNSPTFEHDVLPVLVQHCHQCHGQETQESELDLRTLSSVLRGGANGPAITRGHPESSLVLDLLKKGDMPPEGEEKPSADEIALIERWIEAGAPAEEQVAEPESGSSVSDNDRRYWPFQRPTKREIPIVQHVDRVRTPVDAFLLARLESAGLMFSPEADRLTLIRRAYFDLIGLPPSPEEVEDFVADPSPNAYEQMIDRLLQSPHYGERWGRHWLDAAGYVDNCSFDGDAGTVFPHDGIHRYRDYVVRAFNEDKPFDRFITEQLAGDEMVDWRSAPEYTQELIDLLVATGYLRSVEDHTSAAQYGIEKRYEVLFQLMEMVSSSILGLTMDCCRCHNHKYDPISQRDYYRLMAAFEPALNVHNWKVPTQRTLTDVPPVTKTAIDEQNAQLDKQLADSRGQSEQIRNGYEQRLFDERLAGLPESIRADVKQAIETVADQRTEIQKQLAEKHQAVLAVSEVQVDAVLNDADRAALADLKREQSELESQRQSYGVIQALWDDGPAPTSCILRRGNPFMPGAPVQPGFVEVLCDNEQQVESKPPPGVHGPTSGRRLALAQWLTSPQHPLTARVIVNRAWHHHFGRGIVPTLGNFGHSGGLPSHPELLDWLAVDFQENGWSLKRLHRQIMASTAYRQVSSVDAGFSSRAAEIDPENHLLWRMSLRRLESEIIRDRVLAVSGRLDRTMGGPAVMFSTPPDGLSITDSKRRSLYVFARRVYPLSFLEVFDAPIMPVNCPQRTTSATVLQTFTFLNGGFVLGEADQLAHRVRDGQTADDKALVARLYRMVLCRPPSEDESVRAIKFLADQVTNNRDGHSQNEAIDLAWKELSHMLLCSNEFLYVE